MRPHDRIDAIPPPRTGWSDDDPDDGDLAALAAGRRFTGIDIDPAAVSLAADQLRHHDQEETR